MLAAPSTSIVCACVPGRLVGFPHRPRWPGAENGYWNRLSAPQLSILVDRHAIWVRTLTRSPSTPGVRLASCQFIGDLIAGNCSENIEDTATAQRKQLNKDKNTFVDIRISSFPEKLHGDKRTYPNTRRSTIIS
ncbi:hypothetical protein GALMADRAFT_443884 [Galerina marginata CBS 339.88]|uniref:Uncharacterized protein n=1 Tax=Galerina marginata (strain CBS 339.88) TaxID=685588 RepID=A0A067T4T9_GALM3|nr:hypothetical protein GALMADRAFT_443884 [Galerina marginata CBS 339.88]